jgi:hypothetical protein
MQGFAQLRAYRDYFESAENREKFKESAGVDVYRPKMVLIAGRDYGSLSQNDIIRLKSDFTNSNVDLLTYDELLERIKRTKLS